MDIEALELRREYLRRWRSENKDRVRRYNQTYWTKKARERKKELELGTEEAKGVLYDVN